MRNLLTVDDKNDIKLTPMSEIHRRIDDAHNELRAMENRVNARIEKLVDEGVDDAYRHADYHREHLARTVRENQGRVGDIEKREEDYMKKGDSYAMRTTNMNMEHCLTDAHHNRDNSGNYDRTEWFNVQGQRTSKPCITMKFGTWES